MSTNPLEIVEELRSVINHITFLTLAEAQEIVKEHNSKSLNKFELAENRDGSMTITDQKSGIGLTIEKVEFTG